MKPSTRIVVVALVAVAVAAVVVLKLRRTDREPQAPKPRGTIFLFANLTGASEREDGSAIIIRTVNAARRRGPQVIEYNAGIAPQVRKKYHVLVEPTVIFLDASGREVARHEGDDPATVAAVRADVERATHGQI